MASGGGALGAAIRVQGEVAPFALRSKGRDRGEDQEEEDGRRPGGRDILMGVHQDSGWELGQLTGALFKSSMHRKDRL